MRVGPTVRASTGGVGVGDDRLRHVRLGGLEKSSNGECVVQVVGIKVGVLENRPSLDDTVGWPSQAMRLLNSFASRTVFMRLWLSGNAVSRASHTFWPHNSVPARCLEKMARA